MNFTKSNIYYRLEKAYQEEISKADDRETVHKAMKYQKKHDMKGWECFFVPEDWFYDNVLKLLNRNDVVFDVGAGDLRFDLLMAKKVRKVYAVEINPTILGKALQIINYDLPTNLIAICGNAFKMELPSDVTVVTCLMIHRVHDFPESWLEKRIIYTSGDGIHILENRRDEVVDRWENDRWIKAVIGEIRNERNKD